MNVLRSEKWDESKKYVFFFFFEVIGLADWGWKLEIRERGWWGNAEKSL
jgi:hypothetical protein